MLWLLVSLLVSVETLHGIDTKKKKKGQTGLGKSTLVNTLFASHLIDSKGRQHVQDLHKQTTQIESVSHGKYNSFFFFFV